ncbi:DUF4468 domain-containing protein [Dysgonomonas sp. 216]|uniref:DUF4468 domain-containing protein n=1 Tax=Dysgonomonas sp. 216 TaxID=2302934 RepID=UPI0013CF483C|nr:DUF4468 domain-containing protein [Dysgonomonas sp. 216]NDW19112.1 DUF4468 domain-containing protein [Dysgonomonas sp. 216]
MKKLLLLFIVVIPSLCMAQLIKPRAQMEDYISKIPVCDNRVTFRDTIPLSKDLDKIEVRNRLQSTLDTYLTEKKGIMRLNDTVEHKMAIQVIDHVAFEKKALSMFAMWVKYTLILDYSTDECRVEVRNITFIESDERAQKDATSLEDFSFSSEYVFIEQKYKVALVKEATNKMALGLITNMNELFSSLKQGLTQ